jgi:hypothetical protein
MSDPSYSIYSGKNVASDRAPVCFCRIPFVIRWAFTKDNFGLMILPYVSMAKEF